MDDALTANHDWAGLVTLDLDECYRRLSREPVGRLGFVDQGGPVILPVNFAVDGRSLVFRSGSGSKLSAAIMERPVCLEVDGWDDFEHDGWSVLVKGLAEEVVDPDEVERFESLPVRPWAQPELRCNWVRVRPDEVSGRQIAKGQDR
jgi:nitroimidazol reductase NimA-like FMN-containing flavoprotein (pyridoxamine 5'-phosphate oxidase superfamily)